MRLYDPFVKGRRVPRNIMQQTRGKKVFPNGDDMKRYRIIGKFLSSKGKNMD